MKLKRIVYDHVTGERDHAAMAKATHGQHTQAHGHACARAPVHGQPCIRDTAVSAVVALFE